MRTPAPRQRRRRPPGFLPTWRPFTWVIVILNVLFLIWVISAARASGACEGLTGDELHACQAGEAIGRGIGFLAILLLWALVDVILGVTWLVTRSGRRDCPVCGRGVKKGQTSCPSCGYNFHVGARPSQP
jgi:hypothetical protein